ncbi:MAG: TerB family tellurite resistance protein [Tannerellaceae bacterium]|jgi:cell division protein FtsB|nr:TerB family tellurite resistance protein [Tannerellaceae bacterium]
MYSEKLENLINHALADGVLTEKEKQVLLRNAEAEGIDPDEFEMALDAKMNELKPHPLQTSTTGKKTALDTLLQLLEDVEQRENEKLTKEIEKLLKQAKIVEYAKIAGSIASTVINVATGGIGGVLLKMILPGDGKKREIEEKIKELTRNTKERIKSKKDDIISSFPLPTSKEEILELISYCDLKKYLESIWMEKFKSTISCAKINYSNDKIFLAEISRYEQQYKHEQEQYHHEQKRKKEMIFKRVAALIIVFVVVAGIGILLAVQSNSKAKSKEKARLERINEDLNLAVKKRDLDEAEALATQLAWQYESEWDRCEDEKEAWDIKRGKRLKPILKVRKNRENSRLKQILTNANLAIKNNNLNEAEILANQLIWNYENEWDHCYNEKEAWDKKQREIVKSILKIRKDQEKSRLEQIIYNLNFVINNNRLDEAEILANQLTWQYESEWDRCEDEKKAWDEERGKIIKTIRKIKDSNKGSILNSIGNKVKDFFK